MQALRAREFYIRGRHYVVNQDKVVIVDETTGRPAPQRSWRQGLHQAIEAKEGLPLSAPTENLASLSFQRFFRYYRKLSGVTGTGRENARELWHIYHLPVVVMPTHRPCLRRFAPEGFTATADPAVTDEIRRKTALAFQRLPPRLRLAAVLAVVEEQPHKEVAEALGISVSAVKLRVFRALRSLRKDLQQQGIAP